MKRKEGEGGTEMTTSSGGVLNKRRFNKDESQTSFDTGTRGWQGCLHIGSPRKGSQQMDEKKHTSPGGQMHAEKITEGGYDLPWEVKIRGKPNTSFLL